MLKIALVAGFVLSLATFSFASSLLPAPSGPAAAQQWVVTYE